jgi:hypothetical protein
MLWLQGRLAVDVAAQALQRPHVRLRSASSHWLPITLLQMTLGVPNRISHAHAHVIPVRLHQRLPALPRSRDMAKASLPVSTNRVHGPRYLPLRSASRILFYTSEVASRSAQQLCRG